MTLLLPSKRIRLLWFIGDPNREADFPMSLEVDQERLEAGPEDCRFRKAERLLHFGNAVLQSAIQTNGKRLGLFLFHAGKLQERHTPCNFSVDAQHATT